MKRKYGNRPNWKRVLSRSIVMEKLDDAAFSGHAILTRIERVREPLWVEVAGTRQCVVDDGYSWLSLFPKQQSYVLTAMFNRENKVVQWYIDICRELGLTERGIPWYDDLYLDIVISADNKVSLIDEDDLALALKQGVINKEDYEFAYMEANKLLEQLKQNSFDLLSYSVKLHSFMIGNMDK